MKMFKKFMTEAIELAIDLYTIVGGIALLFIIYGFLWSIVSIIWKYIHKSSYEHFMDNLVNALVKKKDDKKKEEVNEQV
jgi:D-alanyl-lipoteichoic acid acyltransferase DltB (MBOAT superfamily)